jgi:hypothetical protein
MNRSLMMRLSVVLMTFLFVTGCHQWQSDHSKCVEVGKTHYMPSDIRGKVPEYTPTLTVKDYIPSSQFMLAQLAYQSMVPEAKAGTVPISVFMMESVVGYAVSMQRASQAGAIADQFIVLANNARAVGQTAAADAYMAKSAVWDSRAMWYGTKAAVYEESMLMGIPAKAMAGLHIITPDVDILIDMLQNQTYMDGMDPGMYYDDQASMNRGYDHMQGAGILDGWIANRSSKRGSGGGDSDAGHVCEYDNFFMPPGDPDEDDPCNDHRTTGLFPETETPVGTVMLQSLANNMHWVNVIQSMQRQQLEFGMGELLVYDYDLQTSAEMASWHMDFPFIKAFALIFPDGYSAHYYEDPTSGEQVFAFGMEINGQFIDIESGDYYGEMFPNQSMFTVYSAENVYGVNY